MVASTAVRFAAVAAKFPAVREDYIIALCELASVKPTAFRLQIALEESFFDDIAQILEARGLQDVQFTVAKCIEALFDLQCGQSLEIPLLADEELRGGGLPPREAMHGTSAGAAIQITRLGFQGGVCEERKSDITKRVQQMVYVAYDDETAWTYAGNRECAYCPEYISQVGPPIKLCLQVRCPDTQPHVSLKRGNKKYGAAWLPTEIVPVGIIIECLGNQPVLLPEELVRKMMTDLPANVILSFAADMAMDMQEELGEAAKTHKFLCFLTQFQGDTTFPQPDHAGGQPLPPPPPEQTRAAAPR